MTDEHGALDLKPILHLVVVDFHHKKGCQVEYVLPPFWKEAERADTNELPEAWRQLPSLALPDGAHNFEKDTVFFVLPPRVAGEGCVFCVSCFRQMESKDLVNRSADVTRSTVQKSVVVMSAVPLFGAIEAKLEVVTHAYFEGKDFSQMSLLEDTLKTLNDQLTPDLLHSHQFIGLSACDLVLRYKHRLLVLFKLLLLEKRVVFSLSPVRRLTSTVLSLVSLFPQLLETGLRDATADSSSPVSVDLDGMPLSLFTEGRLCLPYASLAQWDTVREHESFVVGATNLLFRQRSAADALVDEDEVDAPQLKKVLTLSTADLRFIEAVAKIVRHSAGDMTASQVEGHTQAEYDGGEEWVRDQFRRYLDGLCAAALLEDDRCLDDFNVHFVSAWKSTHNFARWRQDVQQASVTPRSHPCAGQLVMGDLKLKLTQSLRDSESGRRLTRAVAETGRIMTTSGRAFGGAVRSSFSSVSNWLKKNPAQ